MDTKTCAPGCWSWQMAWPQAPTEDGAASFRPLMKEALASSSACTDPEHMHLVAGDDPLPGHRHQQRMHQGKLRGTPARSCPAPRR